jgi:glutathione S-transferase
MSDAAVHALTLIRFIRAPRERVFDAFVQAQLASRWMCPRGMSVPEAQFDARAGGAFRVTMQARNGARFTAGGVYRELVRPQKLAYSWRWQSKGVPAAETAVAVELIERAAGTEIRMTQSGFADALARDTHEEGWGSSLNQLTDLLDERGQAATVMLFGDPRSSYVRTARMGLAEKGVQYTLQPLAPQTPEILALHPFGRIPAFRDGRLALFETSAILRYVDEAFSGPSLVPGTARDRARCEQWVSAINAYLDGAMVRRYVLQYVQARGAGVPPDREVIEGAVKDMRRQLGVLERAYGEHDFLAGRALSMADLFLAPMLHYVEQFPEGKALLAKHPNVMRAQGVIRARASFRDTAPGAG